VAVYSPRIRPGAPVSFPVTWEQLDEVVPADFNLHNALAQLGNSNPWEAQMPPPQTLSAELVAEGNEISATRVQAMHEGKRRARARRNSEQTPGS